MRFTGKHGATYYIFGVGEGTLGMYTNKDVAEKFGISREAARQWANYFASYLSPTATPQKGRQRNYTDEDLSVFALIAEMKATGTKADEILLALASGQRGIVPYGNMAIVPRSDAGINIVRHELALTRQEVGEITRELDKVLGENRLLRQQLKEASEEIRNLYRENARLEVQKPPKDE